VAEGAGQVNEHAAVATVLNDLGIDLRQLGLLEDEEGPKFEAGAVSRRELLQALRLALPATDGVAVPIERQGRGAQRLLLVAALLRLARTRHTSLLAAFDEPEQALEPLRQSQLIEMLRDVTQAGGQLFLATHSPEMVRGFTLDDIVLMPSTTRIVALSGVAHTAKRHYERSLDGAVVRGLFAPVPLLVEGPGDRPVLQTFWRALATAGEIPPMASLGVDVVNCEGADQQAPMARLLRSAGKTVVVWAEQDVPDKFAKLHAEGNWSALILHDPAPDRNNLERSLAQGASIEGLVAALQSLAEDRGADWNSQRSDLLSRCEHVDLAARESAKQATTLQGFLEALAEADARTLAASALAPKVANGQPPFEMKGARQGRLVAEAIVSAGGVPAAYRRALIALVTWLTSEDSTPVELLMASKN